MGVGGDPTPPPTGGPGERHPLVEQYVAALAGFGQVLQAVADDEWDLTTPCPDWDVQALVAHVVVGEMQLTDLDASAGAPVDVEPSILGRYPLGTWRGTALAAIAAASEPGFVDRMIHTPGGSVTAATVLAVRCSENLVHGWDLARAIGQPYEPPDSLVLVVWALWSDPASFGVTRAGFADRLPVLEGASDWEQLLALLGRRG